MQRKNTIAEVAMAVMFEQGANEIDMGCFGLLDDIYGRCQKEEVISKLRHHPLDRQSYIMKQLRKSPHFKNVGYIDYPGFGRAYSKCAVLEIKSSQK